MKTINLIWISLLFSITISAQVKTDTEIETLSGYEYNYFKSPEEVRQDGIIFSEKDLIKSSSFQDVLVDYDYRKKWKNNRLRFSVKPYARLFYESMEDSYWSVLGSAKYDYKLNKSAKLLAEASVKRMNRKGLDGAQDILINPLAYTNFGTEGGIEFEPVKNNETRIKAFYNFRDFDKYGVRNLQYNEWGLELKITQEIKFSGLKHEYGLLAYTKKRLYNTFNASNIITDGKRDWNYLKATVFYEYPLNQSFEIEPRFVYYTRSDNKDDRSSFRQFGPSVGIKFDQNKTRVRSNIKYINRRYKSIEARDNNGFTGEKIRYNYFDFTLDVKHELMDNLFMIATVYSRIRTTNYSDIDARSFRGYRNQYLGLGIQWIF